MNNESLNILGQLRLVETRGYSAYEVAVQNGFVGTEEEWLESLVGPQGPEGEPGEQGTTNYEDTTNKPKIAGIILQGDLSLSDLGIQPAGNYVPYAVLIDYVTFNDLANYVQKTDYATDSQPGLIVGSGYYGLKTNSNGTIEAQSLSYSDYSSKTGGSFIGKTTLENVIIGKGLNPTPTVVVLTETEYNNLQDYDVNTEYHIIEE